MKKLQFLKSHWAKFLSVLFFVLLLGSYIKIFAIGSPYSPGQILDPLCAPGEENCIVAGGAGGPSGSNSQIQFNNNGIFGASSDLTWIPGSAGSSFSLGPNVTFSKIDFAANTDTISPYVVIARGSNKALYNAVNETSYNDITYVSPQGTEWNSEGWGDLSDVKARTYVSFYDALGGAIDDNILGAELVMHDIVDDKYYKFSFASWTTDDGGGYYGDGGGVSYTRNVINLASTTNKLTTSSNVLISGNNRYLNFGTDVGSSGYGFRDTNGILKYKNLGGTWSDIEVKSAIKIVNNSSLFSTGLTDTGTNSTATNSIFLGNSAGSGATNPFNSNFLGSGAGSYASNANNSNFFGYTTGQYATNAYNSNFLGSYAGQNATNAYESNFLGYGTGYAAINASYSNFFGDNAGASASSASYSNFFGNNAGNYATNASYSNFLGNYAGNYATNAKNSIFIGQSAGYYDTVNNTTNTYDFSILIGNSTSTGGNKNSIALGAFATNTAQNQFMIGSVTRPINTTIWNTAGGTTCTLVSTGLTCTSDQNFKTNIHTLGDNTDFYEQLETIDEQDINTEDMTTLEKVISIVPVKYDWKASKDEEYYFNQDINPSNIGFIAQDLELYFPELVAVDVNGNKSVNYANMTPILTEAIRELNLKVNDLSSLDVTNATSLGYLIKSFLVDQSVLIHELTVNKLNIDGEVCVDDTCITKEQFKQMIITASTVDNSSDGDTEIPPVVTPPVYNPDGTLTPEEIEAQRLADLETERLAKEAEDKAIADKAEADRIEAERIAAELEAQKNAGEGL